MTMIVETFEWVEVPVYLRARLDGKVKGKPNLPLSYSDFDRTYDLEFLDCELSAKYEDFSDEEVGEAILTSADGFKVPLPNPVKCSVTFKDGTRRFFNINLKEPRAIGVALSRQVYESGQLYSTISAEIFGQLVRVNKRKIFIELPAIVSPISPSPRLDEDGDRRKGTPSATSRPIGYDGLEWVAHGCFYSLAILVGAYFTFAVVLSLVILVWPFVVSGVSIAVTVLVPLLLALVLIAGMRRFSIRWRWVFYAILIAVFLILIMR